MIKKFSGLTAAILALTGCSSGLVTLAPGTTTVGSDVSAVTITDNGDGTWTLSGASPDITTGAAVVGDYGGSQALSTHAFNLVFYTLPSGAGEVRAFASDTYDIGASQFIRLQETTLPDRSDTASYSGNSAALTLNSEFSTDASWEGIVSLSANFDTSRISGSVTDRWSFGSVNDPTFGISASNITLEETDLVDGTFSGTTLGGNFSSTTAGTYGGGFVGPNGEEILGTFTFEDGGGTTHGIFWADEDP